MAKTLFLSNLSQYAFDIGRAFERLGWTVWSFPEPELAHWVERGETPDLVLGFIINPPLHDACEKRGIPHAWWVLDSWTQSPNLIGDEQQLGAVALGFPPIDTRVPYIMDGRHLWTFSVSQELLPTLKGQAQIYLPFHVNASRFQYMGLPKKYDVGFIGSSLLGLDHIDGVTMLEMAGIGLDKIGLIEDIPTRVSWQMLVGMRESAETRVKVCQAAKAHVWGDGWDKVEGITHMGRADFRKMLPDVINECVVNVNVSRNIFPLDLCPRLFEVLACGGILVSNDLTGPKEAFGPYGAWMKPEDMTHDNLMWYANQESTRKMAAEAVSFIKANHTWEHAARRICEVVGV